MDWKAIGEFIAKLRKEKGMTQEELAQELICTRHSISKWENGINIPNTEILLKLGEIFDISINEILACKRRPKETKNEIDNISLKLILDSNKKIKRIIKLFLIIFAILISIFFFYYFLNTYNSLYVYKIAGENTNFSSLDGIVIFSKYKCYFKLGNIISKNNIDNYKYELFYYDKDNKENIILESENTNDLLITSFYDDDNNFTYKNKDQIIKNTYLKIIYNNQEEIIKLDFQRDMVNDKIFFFKRKTNKKEYNNYIMDNILEIENKFLNKFNYNSEEQNYFINGNIDNYSYKIKYSNISKKLEVYEYKEDTYIFQLDLIFNELKYSKYNNGKIDDIFKYSFDKEECILGNCSEVQSFIDKYYNKYIEN